MNKDEADIYVTVREAGKPGGQCGLLFQSAFNALEGDYRMYEHGHVFLGPGVTLTHLNKKQNIKNVHLRRLVDRANRGEVTI